MERVGAQPIPDFEDWALFFSKQDLSAANSSSIRRSLWIPHHNLHESEFAVMLAKRIPFVITHLNQKIQRPWSPEDLSRKYGNHDILIEDCETGDQWPAKLSEFFLAYQDPPGSKVWKLKVCFRF
jgi:hypothetical protein